MQKVCTKSRIVPERAAWPLGTCSVIHRTVATATISRITSGSRGNSGYVSSRFPTAKDCDH